jgi:hypothetical protein
MLNYHFNTIFKSLRIFSLALIGFSSFASQQADIQHILNGVNHYRMLHLLSPLKLNPNLSKIAAQHSQNMANHVYPFGHIGFDKRFAKIRQVLPNTLQASENVAYGYKSIDAVVTGWEHSPGHRANILGPFNQTGIAIAYDNQHRPYYTQVFAKQSNHSIHPINQNQTKVIQHRHRNIGPNPMVLFNKASRQLAKLF